MRYLWALPVLLLAAPIAAEIIPEPSAATPRIQTVRWQEGQTIQLTALPATALTLLFEPGETIVSVAADASSLTTSISHERNALLITPLREGVLGSLRVTTARRGYAFSVRTSSDLMAAYLVRFDSSPALPANAPVMAQMPSAFGPPGPTGQSWSYRLRGDRAVRPAQISDDGSRTYISFAEDSALPAIFVVGPTGEEQVVNGYMRGGRFVIDQVWPELVFRIDAKKATARRSSTRDNARG
ncbi:MAG: TrbG/VirB9 family P-type conjugative transfer protein [Qipengyuania sp.]|nr:TrbG/VirB9 family P-type conjugative transfer protein [Qipengyuania sp.]